MTTANSFWRDTVEYASEVRNFGFRDWLMYIGWVGLMMGLFFAVTGFLLIGHFNGVVYPAYVWNIPLGTLIFSGAISFDTIGHRTRYKTELLKGEGLVHGITIFAGISSCLLLCLAYTYPEFLKFPTLVMILMSVFYSMIDEALHWRRYFDLQSDRVEMWSHFFIFLGHGIMIMAWYYWFTQGYPGVAETLAHWPL